jgi:hypothetical protein
VSRAGETRLARQPLGPAHGHGCLGPLPFHRCPLRRAPRFPPPVTMASAGTTLPYPSARGTPRGRSPSALPAKHATFHPSLASRSSMTNATVAARLRWRPTWSLRRPRRLAERGPRGDNGPRVRR